MWGGIAAPLRGQKTADADKAGAKSADNLERELDIRYAQAYLNLMEATLGKYEEINRTRANTIQPAVIDSIRDAVRKARERVQLAQSDDVADSQIYVATAEVDLRAAESALQTAESANARSPHAVNAGEVARLKAQVVLAKIRVERARHLASESPLSNVRYEIELFREDLQELQLRVALLRQRN